MSNHPNVSYQSAPTPAAGGPPRVGGYTWAYAIVFVLALAVFAGGVYLAARGQGWAMLAAGCASIVGVLVAWPIAATLAQQARALDASLVPVREQIERAAATLAVISEQQLISDRAKQVAFREKDRDAFRRAIQEDLAKQDYDAALVLVHEMEQEFGYKQEAERLRAEVTNRRDEAARRQIDTAMIGVERLVEGEQWQQAFREAERLQQLFPDQVRAQTLPGEIEARRQQVKRQLLVRWQELVRSRDVDGSIGVLRKLDAYLTPVEAAGLEEDARMIFREKLNQLRERFTTAVGQHDWATAKRVGQTVIDDFPNSQMASEVRDMMPTLDERLRGGNGAAIGAAVGA